MLPCTPSARKLHRGKIALGTATSIIFVFLISLPPRRVLVLVSDPFHNTWRWHTPIRDRPSAEQFISKNCKAVSDTFDQLISSSSLGPWQDQTLTQRQLEDSSQTIVYVQDDQIYMSAAADRHRWLTPVYHEMLQRLRLRVKLPDLILPLNPGDLPQSPQDNPRFILGFCRDNTTSDVLIPDRKHGDIFTPKMFRRGKVAYRRCSRAGPQDKRKPAAVWRGSVGGRGGMPKGRTALMDLSLERPDLLDAGMRDWDEEAFGPAGRRLKPYMSLRQQVDTYQMQVWVPGNCAAVRFSMQLASDAVVLKLDSPEFEWFQPLLRPWEHFVPVAFNGTHVGIEDAVLWARQHPEERAAIAAKSTAFAQQFLTQEAVDCYMVQLLLGIKRLQPMSFTLPPDATASGFASKTQQPADSQLDASP